MEYQPGLGLYQTEMITLPEAESLHDFVGTHVSSLLPIEECRHYSKAMQTFGLYK
jgi:hypothetical protein